MRGLRVGWMRGAAVAMGLAALAGQPLRADTAPAPSRVALVIGEGAYRAGPLPAAPDDAGLVAQVLAGAGFDVTGARDLDGDGMRRAFRDFLDRAGAAGPDGIAVVYFTGRAVQSDGDDFLVPVDARLARPADVPIEALRLADLTHALAALPIQARVVVVDGAYAAGSADRGSAAGGPASGAPGLALVEAEQGELVAFNAAPGTAAPATAGPYGAYAQALAAAVKQGGVPVGEVLDRVRLAVDRATGGAVVPWHSDRLTRTFTFFDRAPGAPAAASAQVPFAALEKRPLSGFPPAEAYDVAVARDTLPAYTEFLAAFPGDPLARRVRLIVAVRREALFWRAALGGNTPGAYWTYLERYPKGPHAGDARRRLTRLAAAAAPPPRFAPLAFDVAPPGPDDVAYDRVPAFAGPGLPPPPPPPLFLLPPPVELVLERPAAPSGPLFLPVPAAVAIPYVRPPVDPGSIAPPRGVAGTYPRPRPYARGPNGDGLVVQTAPARTAPPEDARPRPPVPNPAPPSGALPPPRLPVPPAVPPAVLPTPPSPSAPRAPTPPVPPATRPQPAPAPPAVPAAPSAPPRPQPSAEPPPGRPPAPAAPPAPPASLPPGFAVPAAPRPAPARPQSPAALPAPASKPEAPPPRPATPAPRPAPPAPAAQRPTPPAPKPEASPAPPRPVPAAPRPVPERPPEPARPPTPVAPARAPEPPASDRPAPGAGPAHPGGGHPPGERRPECGHPGAPPCRP